MGSRTNDISGKPVTATGKVGSGKDGYHSCFVITEDTIDSASKKIVITIDLKKSYFVHAILLVEYKGNYNSNKNTFGPYDLHIGDNASWLENPKCANGPFMDPNDPKSF